MVIVFGFEGDQVGRKETMSTKTQVYAIGVSGEFIKSLPLNHPTRRDVGGYSVGLSVGLISCLPKARFPRCLDRQINFVTQLPGATMLFRRFAAATIVVLSFVSANIATNRVNAEDAAVAETISIFDTAKLAIPDGWARAKPQSGIIEHEFSVKSGKGDDAPQGRVTMMAAGGPVKANIDRWKTQFTGGDAAAQKTEEKKVGKWTVHIADLSGTFAESMGGGPFAPGKVVQREGYAMTGVILEDAEGRKYFIKVTGPMDVVKANRPAVVEMLEGLK